MFFNIIPEINALILIRYVTKGSESGSSSAAVHTPRSTRDWSGTGTRLLRCRLHRPIQGPHMRSQEAPPSTLRARNRIRRSSLPGRMRNTESTQASQHCPVPRSLPPARLHAPSSGNGVPPYDPGAMPG